MVRHHSWRGLEPKMEMQDNPEQFLWCRARCDKNGNCQGWLDLLVEHTSLDVNSLSSLCDL
jgi:hypothetical protein